MSNKTSVLGPFTLEAKVYFTDEAGSVIGSANVGLSVGRVPDEAAIMRAIGQTLAAIGDEYRLLPAGDFFNKVLVKEKTGRAGNFAIPASFSYDPEALAEKAKAAYVPEPADEIAADEADCDYCGDPDCDGECEDE